jgi:predicted TIM-barrel enzyme
MVRMSPRVQYWREKRRRGDLLLAAACASAAEAAACLPLAPDLVLYHPGFAPGEGGDSGMLASLAPLGNANEAVGKDLPRLPELCAPCPVALGACGSDPFLLPGPAFAAWRAAGLEGIANFPTLGPVDGMFRAELESAGLGVASEVAFLKAAHEAGFFTVGFACSPEDAAACAGAGCDALIVHLGLAPDLSAKPFSAARAAWPAYPEAVRGKDGSGPLLLLHGDHLAAPADQAAWKGMGAEGCDGVFAAGGPERIKALRALANA